MNRNKKILIAVAVVFILIISAVSYDMARRTTFPGSEPQLKDRIEKGFLQDTVVVKDSTLLQ